MRQTLLNYIKSIEGNHLHRNATEHDITSPGGIYRLEHPNANIWTYIDDVAISLDILTPSNEWTADEINYIDAGLDKVMIDLMLGEFYDNYLLGAHLDLFDSRMQIVMFNLFTNSMVGSWKSVQRAIWDMYYDNLLDVDKSKISTVDGYYGDKTKNVLEIILNMDNVLLAYFRNSVMSNMRRYYIDLATGNNDKYLIYLKGWNNRIINLKKYVAVV